MKRPVIALLGASALTASALAVGTASPVSADDSPQALPFVQNWSDAALITADDVWTDVPGIVGYRGDGLASTGADPQTVLGEGAPPVVDVNADEVNPNTFTTGGVAEFAIADPTVALQGSGTADAPNLVVTLSTAGFVDVTVGYDARDIDGSADNAIQQLALQYRVGTSGNFTNVPAGYIADATTAAAATLVTPVVAVLPPAADDQPVVQVRIITADASGSDEWVGIDGLSITGTPGGGGPAEPVATCPASLVAVEGEAASSVVSATDADSTIESIAITSPPVDGISLVPGETGSATLEIAPTTAPGAYTVVVTFTTDDDQQTSCEVDVTVLAVSPISAVQGAGATSPVTGQVVIVEGVVTSPFTSADATSGFFVQEEAGDVDSDPATSEGIFVFCGANCPPGVAKGDVVRATGVVQERFGTTQIGANAPGATSIVGTAAVPDAVVLDVPSGAATESAYESIEGMVTTFTGPLTLSEHFNMPRFGEIELIAGGRPFTFTHVAEPTVGGAAAAYTTELANRTIILDDDTDDENDDISGPQSNEPYPYPTAAWAEPAVDGLSTTHRFRTGDTMTDLTGVMQWSFGRWRMRPVPGQAYELTPANPPTAAPAEVGGRLRVASFNVLNYFHTPDTTASESNGPCGPAGTQDCRGADSEAERVLQLTKITEALVALNGDVVGLIEIENDAGQATQDIIDALNARLGAGTYQKVETGFLGTDAIKVAFIYKPATVRTVGAHTVLTSAIDPRFDDRRNRPALIQTFEEIATGERFTASINHLKSKGSSCASDGDPDLGDGAGNCNLTRQAAAQALADYLATDPTASGDPDVIILGDLNAYRNEDPIDTLRGEGYTDLVRLFGGDGAYSFLFDGTFGYLDHALGNAAMTPQVTGVTEWHTNADEPELFDYNDSIRDVGEAGFFERKSNALPLAEPNARRASDHDPVLVGLELASLTVDHAVIVEARRGGGNVIVSGTTGSPTAACPTVALRVDTTTVDVGPTRQLGRTSTCISLTARGLFTFDTATGNFAGALSLPTSFRLTGDTVRFVLTIDGRTYAVDRAGRRIGSIWTTT